MWELKLSGLFQPAAPPLHCRIPAPTCNCHWDSCVSQVSAAPRQSSRVGLGEPDTHRSVTSDSSELVSLWVDVNVPACRGRTRPFNKSLLSACLAVGFFVLLICWSRPSSCWRGSFLPPRKKRHFVNRSVEPESPGKCCEKQLISLTDLQRLRLPDTSVCRRDSVFMWEH